MTALKGVDGFTFGCDPELFVKNAEGNLVSADGLLPGTKEFPHKVEYGAIQVDGMAAEFNIDPVDNFDHWNRNIIEVIRQLKTFLPKGYGLELLPSVRFSPEVMETASDKAKELGCNPDYNAWTGELNPVPDTSPDPLMRTAAGHLHFGWLDGVTEDFASITDELHKQHCFDLVKQLDYYIGGWTVLKDPDPTRRKLYGKAGACRVKPYGVEYRVPSNFWLRDKETRRQIWNRMQQAVTHMRDQELPKKRSGYNAILIETINEGKKDSIIFKDLSYPLQRII